MLIILWNIFFEILLTSIGFFDHYLLLPFIVEGLNCMLMYHQKHIDCCKTCSSRYPFWMRSSISFRDLKILKSESQLKGQCSTWKDNIGFFVRSNVSQMFSMCQYFWSFNVINVLMFSMVSKFLTQESWGHLPMISSRPFPVIWVPCRGLDYDEKYDVEHCGTLLYIGGWWDRWS